MTRHEFKLTNTAKETQKVYAGVNTWDARSYSKADKDCSYDTNFMALNMPGITPTRPKGFDQGTFYYPVFEMEPGQEITGWVELNWIDDQA